MRKAQVIDVREKVDYDYGHINGARNIPITIFKQRYQGLRKDQPVYLCDANGIASYRAARILRKNGFKDIYMLKGGYKNGQVKLNRKNNFTITFIRELKFTLEDDMTMSSFSRYLYIYLNIQSSL